MGVVLVFSWQRIHVRYMWYMSGWESGHGPVVYVYKHSVPWTARLEVVSEKRVEFRVTTTSRGRSIVHLHHKHHAGL